MKRYRICTYLDDNNTPGYYYIQKKIGFLIFKVWSDVAEIIDPKDMFSCRIKFKTQELALKYITG